jgi:SAM-dependent methyltransferase
MEDIERQKEHFNKIADLYYSSRQDKKHLLVKKAIWDSVNIEIEKNALVLEAMCGYCDAIEILTMKASQFFNYDGFDYSDVMVRIAKERYPGAHIWGQDIVQFDSNKKYDFIFVIGGLHHVYKYVDRAIANLINALDEEGRIIIFEPTHNNVIFRKARELIYKHNKLFDAENEKGFSTKEINDLFESKNLLPEQQIFPGLLAYILWYNPDAFPLLNIGGDAFCRLLLALEKPLWRSKLARFFSFATLTVYKKGAYK